MYVTNQYNNYSSNFLKLLDQAAQSFSIESVRVTNKEHEVNAASAIIEKEETFDFRDLPEEEEIVVFTTKYDPNS